MPRPSPDRFLMGYLAGIATVAFFTAAWWAWDNLLLWAIDTSGF